MAPFAERWPSQTIRQQGGRTIIDFDEARRLALQYVAFEEDEFRRIADLRKDLTPGERRALGLGPMDNVPDLVLIETETIEGDFGWIFFYQIRKFLESGDFRDGLVGNAPILISKRDGSLHETGTADSIEFYIENFKRCGNPHG